jgi:hypothetical protein
MTIKLGDRVEMIAKDSKNTGKRGVVVGYSIHPNSEHLKVQLDGRDIDDYISYPSTYFKKIEYNKGDIVTIKATVIQDRSNGVVMCDIESPYHTHGKAVVLVKESEIVTHIPVAPPIQVGDIVRAGKNQRHHEVIGLYNEQAWIRAIDPESDSCYTTYINNLERI